VKTVGEILEEKISAVMAAVSGLAECQAIVRPAVDPKFGDYQANGVMPLAKKLKANPRKLAEEIAARLDFGDICEPPEVAGPGFINLRLRPGFVAQSLLEINGDPENRLGIEKMARPETIVVDFSGPNIAKQMHVGHLRSTIIGDCICRLLEFLGHNVKPQNHIGDWGTQFGKAFLGLWHISMGKKHKETYYQKEKAEFRTFAKDRRKLMELCKRICERHATAWRADKKDELGDGKIVFWPFVQSLIRGEEDIDLEEIEVAYQFVSQIDDVIEGMGLLIPTRERDTKTNEWREILIPYEDLSRRVTAMLQEGGRDNEQEEQVWSYVTKKTMDECYKLYRLLGVTLNKDDECGESFYSDMLHDVLGELKKKGLAVVSDGAVCVFPEGFRNKQGQPLPLIIQKSDGAYLYATTDLAALKYRIEMLRANRIIYVTDARQKLHFEMVFSVARMTGWAKDTELVHVTFGSVLGENGRPLKTREGENVKLKDLLEEAIDRAKAVVEEKNPNLSGPKKAEIARAVGTGAVKYADYSNNRTSDYIFSFDKMLAMDGNTAPYMQYAYARIKSIERKSQSRRVDIGSELAGLDKLNLTEPAELDLAKYLLRYGEAVQSAAVDYRPNYLTTYLYELAQKFSGFYTDCPVLDAEPNKRPTRLLLCDLTARTIQHGLEQLLGIEVVEQM
jgi:arginyl-tRNA synthetase